MPLILILKLPLVAVQMAVLLSGLWQATLMVLGATAAREDWGKCLSVASSSYNSSASRGVKPVATIPCTRARTHIHIHLPSQAGACVHTYIHKESQYPPSPDSLAVVHSISLPLASTATAVNF